MEVLIRQAAESDVQSVSRLQQQWVGEGSVYGFVPESPVEIVAALSPYLLVAETREEVIGFISGSVQRSEGMAVIPEGVCYLEIDNLYVSPEYRRASGAASSPRSLLKLKSKVWFMPCSIRRPKTFMGFSGSMNGTTSKAGMSRCSGSCNRVRGGLKTTCARTRIARLSSAGRRACLVACAAVDAGR